MDAEAVDENSGWRLAFPIKVPRQNAHTDDWIAFVQRRLLGGIGIPGRVSGEPSFRDKRTPGATQAIPIRNPRFPVSKRRFAQLTDILKRTSATTSGNASAEWSH